MTNIFGSPKKVSTRDQLIAAGERVLKRQGWNVGRVNGTGKSSIRSVERGGQRLLVSIKTSQDQWLAFSRTPDDSAWSTLSDVDAVLVCSVDDVDRPTDARVHFIDAADLRTRFDRAYAARRAAGHSIAVGRGVWLSLYEREDGSTTLVGAGAGLDHPPTVEPLNPAQSLVVDPERSSPGVPPAAMLTIAEAKRRLAITFGVDPNAIRITIEA